MVFKWEYTYCCGNSYLEKPFRAGLAIEGAIATLGGCSISEVVEKHPNNAFVMSGNFLKVSVHGS